MSIDETKILLEANNMIIKERAVWEKLKRHPIYFLNILQDILIVLILILIIVLSFQQKKQDACKYYPSSFKRIVKLKHCF